MSDDLSWRLATPRFTVKGNLSRVACGHKKSRNHSRGSEGGPQIEQARLFPHPVFGKTVADVGSDLMSMKSRSSGFEVALLASPSHPRLDSGFFEAFVARYSGTLPHGILTRFPILP